LRQCILLAGVESGGERVVAPGGAEQPCGTVVQFLEGHLKEIDRTMAEIARAAQELTYIREVGALHPRVTLVPWEAQPPVGVESVVGLVTAT
jgi:hypothetical protein